MRPLFDISCKVLRVLSLLLIAALGAVSVIGSGGGEDITGGGVTVTAIDIEPSVVPKELLPGLEQQFVAIATYSDGSQQVLNSGAVWVSSNNSVATVNSLGLATSVSAGTADISASMSGVSSNAVTLNVVNPNLLSIQVSPPSLPNGLPVGASQQFVALGVYDNNQVYDITDRVTWVSDNTSVIAVNSAGVATGQGSATASANVSAISGMVSSNSVNVAVSVQSAVGLIVEPAEAVPLPINRTQQFKALLLYSNNTTFDVTDEVDWISNTLSVATVNNSAGTKGLVTGIATGRATITATHPVGQSGSGVLDVTSATIQTVNILPATPGAIPAEHTENLKAFGTFSDGTTRQLVNPNWYVSDNSVATLNYRGATVQVLGVAAGSATLNYLDTLANGLLSGRSDSVSLPVTDAVLDTITITPTISTMPDDTQRSFSASGGFSDGSSRDITQDVWWVTGDDTVAGFGAQLGELTALSSTVNVSTTAQAMRVNSQGVLKASPVTTVNVQAATLTGLTINAPVSPVSVWDTDQYTVTASFNNGSTADYTERVTWTVDFANPIIADVSTASGTKGQVTAVRAGTATLRVVDPQSGFTQSLLITINSP